MQDALVTLTGNVGTDVEHTEGAGWSLARFRLAVTPRRLREGLWVDQETTWISITAWGRLAENMAASLAKGDPVVVQGRLRTSAWTGSDGTRHERLVVEAVTLGHDLSRGTSAFTRVARTVPAADGSGVVDVTTGEVSGEQPADGQGADEQAVERELVDA